MKNCIYWLCFAGGFITSFLPFLLLPNGWLFVIGPLLGFFHKIQFAIYGPFLLASVLALCEKKWAAGWVLGSIISVGFGMLLFFTLGFGFVHV